MGRFLVVRHAQSTWNAAGLWQGWSDAPLSELGAEAATRAGRALAATGTRPGLVACSDLARARATAELMAAQLGYDKELVVEPDLREQDLGAWNGLTRDEIMARWPAEFEARTEGDLSTVPGGEAGDHFVKRCVAALGRVVARGADEGLVVTHGGAVIALEMALGAWAPDRRRTNLSGWWLESRGAPHDSGLVLLEWVDLLAMSAETVTGPG